MNMPLLKGLFQHPKELLGKSRIAAILPHLLDPDDLLGYTPLTLSNVPISLGQVFAFLLHVGHGAADYATGLGRWRRSRITWTTTEGM
jgi:hypothetical protein